ncbi:MAG: hypothetical protein FD122_1551 [Stygiobacter sp.]|nr:MAG: hypothetical protein FD122_1551 [Stygiobacter sp.]KAF0214377.1 MAG: hypothetical protein FD178_2453 [Ignavibacteria bacterium]
MKDIEYLLSKFIDGEIDADEEQKLFSFLSADKDARKTLYNFIKLNSEASGVFRSNFDFLTDNSKLAKGTDYSFFKRRSIILKFQPLKYAAIFILVIISLFLFTKMQGYSSQLELISKNMKQQSELIEVLKNSIPPVRVTSQDGNKIVIRTNL